MLNLLFIILGLKEADCVIELYQHEKMSFSVISLPLVVYFVVARGHVNFPHTCCTHTVRLLHIVALTQMNYDM